MKGIEWLKADPRILAGLIGKVWSNDSTQEDDPIARANADSYIRMYLEETMALHSTHGATDSRTDEVKESY